MKVLEALRGRRKQRDMDARQQYEDVVTRLATGKGRQPSPDEIEAVLGGRTLEDFEKAVEVKKARIADAALVRDEPALQVEQEKVGEAIKAKRGEIGEGQARVKALEAEFSRLQDQYQAVFGKLRAVGQARGRLVQTCDDPAILEDEQTINGRLTKLAEERDRIHGVMPLVPMGSHSGRFTGPIEGPHASFSPMSKDAADRLAQIDAEEAELRKRLDEIREAKLTP